MSSLSSSSCYSPVSPPFFRVTPIGVNSEESKGEVAAKASETSAPVPKALPEVYEPSAEELARHSLTHLPYRRWCEYCVGGRWAGERHGRGPECRIPVISFDYLLITKSIDS